MKFIKIISASICALAIVAGPVFAGEKTCCVTAADNGKECGHKCCVSAHRRGKSCEKCNPNKEDLKLIKKDKHNKKAADSKTSVS